MKSGHKKARILLVLSLILTLTVYYTFIYYYSLSEADFLSDQLKLEARDQIDLQTAYKEESKASTSSGFNHLFFLDSNLCRPLPALSFQISPHDPTNICLRC